MLIILTGNYNFFNLLTVALCLSLLDDQHVHFWLRKAEKITNNGMINGCIHNEATKKLKMRKISITAPRF